MRPEWFLDYQQKRDRRRKVRTLGFIGLFLAGSTLSFFLLSPIFPNITPAPQLVKRDGLRAKCQYPGCSKPATRVTVEMAEKLDKAMAEERAKYAKDPPRDIDVFVDHSPGEQVAFCDDHSPDPQANANAWFLAVCIGIGVAIVGGKFLPKEVTSEQFVPRNNPTSQKG